MLARLNCAGVVPVQRLNATENAARRTSRRVNRRHNISGCTPYNGYYNCGGVTYQAVTQDGTTVYVVVNP